MNEPEAIARLRRGDIAGLEVLVARYQVQATRAAYLIVRDPALAQDLVQSAFLKAFDRARSFDPQRPFGPWFLKLVLNDAIKAASKRKREIPLGDPSQDRRPSQAPEPERAVDHAETAREIWSALGELSPAQRAAIVQRYYLGLTEVEIANAVGAPQTTIKARLHAARERLRSLLRASSSDMETSL